MNPSDTAPASKPRTHRSTQSFPYLMTVAVASALTTMLLAQAGLRSMQTPDSAEIAARSSPNDMTLVSKAAANH